MRQQEVDGACEFGFPPPDVGEPTAWRRQVRAAGALTFALAIVVPGALPRCLVAGGAARDVEPRAAWTTSRIAGTPQPPPPYTTEDAFPQLTFDQPVEVVPIPGTDRLVVAELGGRIDSFPNDPGSRQRDLFFDLKAHAPEMANVYALAFHPRFTENRQLFVCYVLPSGHEDGSRVSRFHVRDTNPPRVDPDSEEVVLTWLSGGHNGCSLQFGPDGFLYISTGDGVGPNPPDTLGAGQSVSNLLSSILRIDVDRPGPERAYAIPEDNPFVDLPGARPEVWAYGFRNPWRMSFDRASGDLWVGDVGWELWELIHRVEAGGNYGWSIMEGRQPINPDGPRGPTPILPPTVDHSHDEAASITGGRVYWGDRLEALRGAYIYGDYETGKVWGLRLDEHGEVAWHEELADTPLRIVSFGVDLDERLYLLDHRGSIHRLIPNPDAGRLASFPRRLSETGLFESVPDQRPAPGVVPYSINATRWQDGATSRRWIALPDASRVEAKDGKWTFPEGAVLVKTLELPGAGGKSLKVETQLLHFDSGEWRGYSYRWDPAQQDAELVPPEGDEAPWTVGTGSDDEATILWRYASRADCLRCHNTWSGPPLAFDAMHLDREVARRGQHHPQLDWLDARAVSRGAAGRADRPTLVDPDDDEADLDRRARSYLHVNCAHCHRLHAGGSVLSHMQYDLPLSETRMVDARPSQGDWSIEEARVIAPGAPGRSVLLYRVAKTGAGRMPRLGARQVDPDGVALLHRWIGRMDAEGRVEPGRVPRAELPAWLTAAKENGAPDAGQLAERIRSPADALEIAMAMDRGEVDPLRQERVAAAAAEHPKEIVRDLLERFLPEDQRRERLRDRIDPKRILTLQGDPERGERLFFAGGALQCNQCHQVAGRGKPLGPDLSDVGSQRSREELLESMLDPSRKIDPEYQTYILETVDGRVLSGLLVERTAERFELRDAEHRETAVAAEDVQRLTVSPQSMMPDGVLSELTAQEAADLIAFLASLHGPPSGS